MPDSLAHQQLHEVVSDVLMYGAPIFLAIFFKGLIEEMVSGLLFRIGSRYDKYDIVIIDDLYARINHIGWFKTDFTVYRIEDNKVVGGEIMVVQNSELRKAKIREPLTLLDIPKTLRDVAK